MTLPSTSLEHGISSIDGQGEDVRGVTIGCRTIMQV